MKLKREEFFNFRQRPSCVRGVLKFAAYLNLIGFDSSVKNNKKYLPYVNKIIFFYFLLQMFFLKSKSEEIVSENEIIFYYSFQI
jgi:hypothetical protein